MGVPDDKGGIVERTNGAVLREAVRITKERVLDTAVILTLGLCVGAPEARLSCCGGSRAGRQRSRNWQARRRKKTGRSSQDGPRKSLQILNEQRHRHISETMPMMTQPLLEITFMPQNIMSQELARTLELALVL